jgi:UDP-N-acetylmuramate: L-alanyl-gamma-D-glutamyl-meso-diaminopimelate ligase
MHIHILGICGTFMGGIARLAIEKGYRVTGSDQNCYPPMSTQLEDLGVELHHGFDAAQLKLNSESGAPDCVIVGNAMSRGIEVVEALLNSNIPFLSGPQWLSQEILQDKWVLAVAGTHGKTSTASMIAWILEVCGYNPSFLIGGVMENFEVSARLTDSPFFVVEADEYDTAFFDKRSKFVHYRARTCVLNNLEFDHADIFDDLKAIETQFHHLVRTIPEQGLIITPSDSKALQRVLAKGCWTPIQKFSGDSESTLNADDLAIAGNFASCMSDRFDWSAKKISKDGREAHIVFKGDVKGQLNWSLMGEHNLNNALAAIAAAHHVGVQIGDAIAALASFKNVKRRMELKGEVNQIKLYDDFAHHPTAIKTTLQGLRDNVGQRKIIAIVDPRSNTMKQGIHKETLLQSVEAADQTIFHIPDAFDWQLELSSTQANSISQLKSVNAIIDTVIKSVKPMDTILVMSNGSFGDIHNKILDALESNGQ